MHYDQPSNTHPKEGVRKAWLKRHNSCTMLSLATPTLRKGDEDLVIQTWFMHMASLETPTQRKGVIQTWLCRHNLCTMVSLATSTQRKGSWRIGYRGLINIHVLYDKRSNTYPKKGSWRLGYKSMIHALWPAYCNPYPKKGVMKTWLCRHDLCTKTSLATSTQRKGSWRLGYAGMIHALWPV